MSNLRGPFGITVAHNATEVGRVLSLIGRSQIPFAASVSLTKLAQAYVAHQRSRLPGVFKLRSKGLVNAIRMTKRADKKDWPHSAAVVGYGKKGKDEFWAIQETGGIKRGKKGGRVAVPLRIAAKRRKTSGAIGKDYRPKGLLASGKGRIEEGAGPGKQSLRARLYKRAKAPEYTWYFLRRRVKVKRSKLRASEEALELRRKLLPAIFEREMRAAIKSARVRPGSFTSEAGKAFYLKALRAGQ